jgi:hypothetical protein
MIVVCNNNESKELCQIMYDFDSHRSVYIKVNHIEFTKQKVSRRAHIGYPMIQIEANCIKVNGSDKCYDTITNGTRYVYEGKTGGKSGKGRDFCEKMMGAKKIYRKEDIIKMGDQVVNKGFGPRGTDFYSIWLHKGGSNCYHRWNKQVYATFSGKALNVGSKELKQVAVRKAEKLGYVVKNEALVSTRPIDTPTRGYLPKND